METKKMYFMDVPVYTLTINVLVLQYGTILSYNAADLDLFKHTVRFADMHTHM